MNNTILSVATHLPLTLVQCQPGSVRLSYSTAPLEGTLEICSNETWHTLCDRCWDNNAAAVVCHQLGYSRIGTESLSPLFQRISPQFVKFLIDAQVGITSIVLILLPSCSWISFEISAYGWTLTTCYCRRVSFKAQNWMLCIWHVCLQYIHRYTQNAYHSSNMYLICTNKINCDTFYHWKSMQMDNQYISEV